MKKGLIALAFGGFGIGVTEFSMMGMLEDVANYLQITIPQAGHLISIYAAGVVVGAPLLVLFSSKVETKRMLMYMMILFTVFNGLTALAPNYEMFLVARFLSGMPHGAFFGVATVAAKRMAVKGKEAQSISMVFLGLTVANLIGVPLATYVGHHLSWRWSFFGIFIIGLITLWMIIRWVPKMSTLENVSIRNQLRYFQSLRSWWLIAVVAIGTGSMFAWISYIAPMMTVSGGFSKDIIARFMILAGLGMFSGNILGGILADRIQPAKLIVVVSALISICLVTIYFTIHIPWMAILMTFVTGAVAFSVGASIQMIIIDSGRGVETLAAATGQASFNIGNALGAFLGGIPIALGYSMQSPQLVGAGLALCGSVLSFTYWIKYSRIAK